MKPLLTAMLACVAAGALAGPAGASPVMHVSRDGVRVVEDPYLPPAAATDLPPPGAAAGSRPRATSSKGPTVKGAVRDALLAGAILQEDHDRYRDVYDEARSLRRRLSGARRNQLHSVIATLERIASAGSLSPGRMPALFLQLERNIEFWRTRAFPAVGARVTFEGSPLVFQYYAGQGLQIQPLANFGKANGLYNACQEIDTRPGTPCRKQTLRDLLDDLVAIAARRGDFTTWEYYFSFGGGSPPWTSGLSQGTALQALARGSVLLEEPSYLEVARAGLGAFERRAPTGVRVPAEGGNHYLIYSFNPRLRVLNGFLQSIIGLFDFFQISGDPRASALFLAGDAAARKEVPRYDTGAWSLYSLRGRESDLGYHRLLRDFLERLCERTTAPIYCETAPRFTRYLLEGPRLDLLGTRRARAGSQARVRFRVSKISRVSIQVSRGGRLVHQGKSVFGYGVRYFGWTPGAPGRYRVRLEAADLRNHHTVRLGHIDVRPPR